MYVCALLSDFHFLTALSKTSLICVPRKRDRQKAEGTEFDARAGVGSKAHRRLMTKALMRMMSRTTLPTTDTSNTVELAPSPIMGAGTIGERREKRLARNNKKKSKVTRYPSSLRLLLSPRSVCSLSLHFTILIIKSTVSHASLGDNDSPLGCVLDRVIIMRCCLYLHYKRDTWASSGSL